MKQRPPIKADPIGPFRMMKCDEEDVRELEEDYEILKASFDATTKMCIALKEKRKIAMCDINSIKFATNEYNIFSMADEALSTLKRE